MNGRGQVEDLSVDGRIMLNWTLNKQNGRVWIELVQDRDQ
jgi:hypothetical protein